MPEDRRSFLKTLYFNKFKNSSHWSEPYKRQIKEENIIELQKDNLIAWRWDIKFVHIFFECALCVCFTPWLFPLKNINSWIDPEIVRFDEIKNSPSPESSFVNDNTNHFQGLLKFI